MPPKQFIDIPELKALPADGSIGQVLRKKSNKDWDTEWADPTGGGTPGPQGPQGDTGPAGPTGATGPTGPAGADGAPGADGATGAQGPQGDTGATGAKGDKGDPGDPAASWPIGSVFISVVSTNPNTLLGFGTWVAFAAGKMLVGLDAGQTEFDVVEETGGAKTKAISAHSGAAVANHSFTQPTIAWPAGVPTQAAHTHDSHTIGAKAGSTGGNVAVTAPVTHSSVAPAISWPAGVPVASGGAVNAHSVTQPDNHSDLNVLPPYIVVYMWKRTA